MQQFEWEDEKNLSNFDKHGVRFEYAALVFEDPEALSFLDDRFNYGEVRWVTIGRVEFVTLYVAHTVFEDQNGQETIRIISARQATPGEQGLYLSRR